MENRSLWLDLKTGSRKAYELIIRTYYQELYCYGVRLVDNPDFVKDCIHDLFVNIWERRAFLGDTDNIRLYLFKSLRNRIMRGLEKEARQSFLDVEKSEERLSTLPREDEIVNSEKIAGQNRKLGFFLSELTDRQREVIHLRFFEGLSNGRIAEIMNISKPAVANLLHGTLRTLRALWQTSRFIFALLMCY